MFKTKEMTQEQIVENMKSFLGMKVIIMKPNKHHGKIGKTIRAEIPKGKNKAAMIVKLEEDGKEIQVFNGSQLFFVINEIREDRISEN